VLSGLAQTAFGPARSVRPTIDRRCLALCPARWEQVSAGRRTRCGSSAPGSASRPAGAGGGLRRRNAGTATAAAGAPLPPDRAAR